MSANQVTMEAYRESNVLSCFYFIGACKRIINRTHHNTSDSPKASIRAGFADIETFIEPKVLVGTC